MEFGLAIKLFFKFHMTTYSVAVVGGGISGLCCALRLQELGIRATVFDTGNHAAGGRCSSRAAVAQHGDGGYHFDHSAQFFTVPPPQQW